MRQVSRRSAPGRSRFALETRQVLILEKLRISLPGEQDADLAQRESPSFAD
jgi:hypothetical protein